MVGSGHLEPNDTRDRKRERDKQNQRRKRLREKDVLEELERRNKSLEGQLNVLSSCSSTNVKHFIDKIAALEGKIRDLESRFQRVNDFATSWTTEYQALTKRTVDPQTQTLLSPVSCDDRPSNAIGTEQDHAGVQSFRPAHVAQVTSLLSQTELEFLENHRTQVSHTSDISFNSVIGSQLSVSPTSLETILALPAWQRLPLHMKVHKCFDPFGSIINRLKTSSEVFAMCDAEPKVLDLMMGGSTNELANGIFQATIGNPLRRPERFAVNWLGYIMSRWMIDPTQENYDRIPHSLRPTAMQMFIPHAPIFDYILWPQMRDNFIKYGTKYCRGEIMGLLYCTCRIRDTPNTSFYVRSKGDDLQLDDQFLQRISNVEEWVLLDRFWTEYPELVEGLDPEKYMIFEKDLV